MATIYEYVKITSGTHEHTRIIIRENNYSMAVSKFDDLIEEATHDFPGLKREDIEIVVYGGDRIKRIPGIEFTIAPSATIPPRYQQIHEAHLTL